MFQARYIRAFLLFFWLDSACAMRGPEWSPYEEDELVVLDKNLLVGCNFAHEERKITKNILTKNNKLFEKYISQIDVKKSIHKINGEKLLLEQGVLYKDLLAVEDNKTTLEELIKKDTQYKKKLRGCYLFDCHFFYYSK